MIDLPNTASWLEFSIVLGLMLTVSNLFVGLIIDSIAEARASRTLVESLLT
jgi:ABC-type Na+ efflux pump permease subunit